MLLFALCVACTCALVVVNERDFCFKALSVLTKITILLIVFGGLMYTPSAFNKSLPAIVLVHSPP